MCKVLHLIFKIYIIIFTFSSKNVLKCFAHEDKLEPSVFIAILARNKAHTLPHFLGYIEQFDYPLDRVALWIRSDHNIDNTIAVLKIWIDAHQNKFHSVNAVMDEESESFFNESGVFEWSASHFRHIINLKEEAFQAAKKMWAHYIWFLDADVFIVNNRTLKLLVQEQKPIIAPLMETLGAYSNYWCGMTEQGYYKRTEDYLPILERETIGCFDVPMVHSSVLIDLHMKKTHHLTFDSNKLVDYSGPVDDIITFAFSARSNGIKMYIINTEPFGYMMAPLEKENSLQDDKEQLINLKVEMMVDLIPPEVHYSPVLENFVPKKDPDTLGFDQVYLINLERRPLKKARMMNILEEFGISVHVVNAVDGHAINDSFIRQMGIKMLPEYSDPYHKRPLTRGEIGCFLSHFDVWKDMIHNQHRTALVLEDDLRFEPYFRRKVQDLLKEIQKISLLYDLIYLGRKRLSEAKEPFVQGSTNLVHVDYSYWTLCYLLTLEGAKKLVSANPLHKMVPVDEFLPIMFDRHPEEIWKGYYPKRNLRAFSVHPLLIYPTHYTGEENYISDTEDSDVAVSVIAKDEL